MKNIRCGSGLGDSIYLRPIAEYFVRNGSQVVALSDHPDVFIGSGASVEPFRRDRVDVVAHYTMGKNVVGTSQFQDMCNAACIRETVPLQIDWTVRNSGLVADLQREANGRPIIVAHGGRTPMARTDGFGAELLPRQRAFDIAMAALRDCFVVGIGGSIGIRYPLAVECSLIGQTAVSDLLDIASICAGVIGQCSFAIPLAEVFDKPLLVLWSVAGLESSTPYVRSITPAKVLSKPTSRYVLDDAPEASIQEAVRALYRI